MKYETPELTALTPAINAIQTSAPQKGNAGFDSSNPPEDNDGDAAAYQDWE